MGIGESFESSSLIRELKAVLGKNTNLIKSNWNGLNYLTSTASSTGLSEIGLKPIPSSFSDFELIFLNGVSDIQNYRKNNKNAFIVYTGSHYSVANLELCDLILPISLFIETDFTFINTEGLLQKGNRIRGSIGESRPEWFFYLTLLSFLNTDYPFLNYRKKKISNYSVEFNLSSTISNNI